jgi:quercetin dioxygenase-like cupin family protein
MNFPGNFLQLGTVDISPVKQLVERLTDAHWTQEIVRQQRYEAHKDTQTIGIAYDEDFRHMNPTRRPASQVFDPVLKPVFKFIADYYESSPEIFAKFGRQVQGYFIRVNLVKLLPGGHITEHQDMNFSLAHSHRVHIPIITNDRVLFNVGQETITIKEGEVIEINNRRIHSVLNKGETGRVHLILDWVFPWEPCCCSAKTHPGTPCSPQVCIATDRLRIPCTCYPEE